MSGRSSILGVPTFVDEGGDPRLRGRVDDRRFLVPPTFVDEGGDPRLRRRVDDRRFLVLPTFVDEGGDPPQTPPATPRGSAYLVLARGRGLVGTGLVLSSRWSPFTSSTCWAMSLNWRWTGANR